MSRTPFERPRILSNYQVWCEPPDDTGDEVLHFVSGMRSLKLKGHSFREFTRRVVPLLDGKHPWREIQEQAAGVFSPEDLAACLELLEQQNILEDAGQWPDGEMTRRIEPQRNLFHELGSSGAGAQEKLAAATVSVLGLGGCGTAAALSLAAAGVGTLRLIDGLAVRETDVYFTPSLQLAAVGASRAVVAGRMIEASAPEVAVRVYDSELDSETDIRAVVEGSSIVVCCLDAGQSNLVYKLNRVCLDLAIPWICCALTGTEIILGPAVHPDGGPCYLCYRMRCVACARNPEDAFELERRLDRRRQDDSGRSENLVFSAGAAGNLIGVEILKELTGIAATSLVGKIAVFDLLEHSIAKHVILRQPFCPACSGRHDREKAGAVAAGGERTTNETPAPFNDRVAEIVSERVGLIRSLTFPRREAGEPNPPAVCLAILSNFDYRKANWPERVALGKGSTEVEARTGAICKALERYCGCQIDAGRLRRAAFNALGEDAIAPPDFVLYSEAQYATKYFPHRRWSPDDQIHWVSGQELPGGVPVLVPATLVYMTGAPEQNEDFVQTVLSNGMAAAQDLETAVLNGLYELIERDAFLIHWMNRLPAPELEYGADCGLAGSIRAHYARFGVELRVFDISTDLLPYVMMAIAQDQTGDGPATLAGLGCHLDAGVALLKASMDICQARPGHVRRYRESPPRERLKSYSDVRFVEDHSQFAAIPENLGEFEFLLKNGRQEKLSDLPARTAGAVRADLARCVASLREAGCRPVYVDVTTEDVAGCGLKVVRTLATGLQPLHFGYAQERLGGRRLFDVPCRLGLVSDPRAEAELNPCPHPLG